MLAMQQKGLIDKEHTYTSHAFPELQTKREDPILNIKNGQMY